jgi:hypothetical protein
MCALIAILGHKIPSTFSMHSLGINLTTKISMSN